jgi:hypothetical protein
MCFDAEDCFCYEEFTTGDEKLDLLIKRFLYENAKLKKELAEDKEELRKLREHLGTRITIEEARPPLSVGKPCYRCGQIYTGG